MKMKDMFKAVLDQLPITNQDGVDKKITMMWFVVNATLVVVLIAIVVWVLR